MRNRILIITLEYGRRIQGGVGRVVNGIFNTKMEHVEIDIFLIKLPIPGRVNMAYVYRKDNSDVASCYHSGPYLEVLRKVLNEENYSGVHLMCSGKLMNDCILEIKKWTTAIPIIYSCHSIAKHEISIRNNDPSELEYEQFMMKNVDHIHVLDNTSLHYLIKCYPEIDKTSISIIPNAIDESEFTAMDEVFSKRILSNVNYQKDILICCLTRWSYGKGLEIFLDAVPKVVKKYSHAKFVLAGRKVQSWEYKVEEYVRRIDLKVEELSENVISLGWLNNKERNTLFSMATLCVMPSLLEYFPYSILEPMVCKVPIVSSGIESVRELLEEGKECSFYSPQDSNMLASCIINQIENKEQRNEMAENAYHKVKQLYNWRSVCGRYDEMYTTVLRKSQVFTSK